MVINYTAKIETVFAHYCAGVIFQAQFGLQIILCKTVFEQEATANV
jgi:hypothetical protein